MPFQISDLAGLSTPLTRLIEVISAGIGKVSAPFLLTRTSKAKAKELKQIAEAIKSVTNDADLSISYADGKIVVKALESQKFITQATTIENRAADRILFEASKQQLNLEKVSSHAALELLGEQSVPDAKPDEDWIARFFDYAKNISSDQMQEIWGRILVGEIKQPGAFSLRTLEIVRNLSQQECELFTRVAQYAFYTPSDVFIPNNIGAFTDNKLVYRHLVALAEIGLLQQSSGSIYPFRDGKTETVFAFSNDVAVLVIKNPEHRPRVEVGLSVWIFTRPARELVRFFSWENPPGYVELFCKEITKLGWIPEIGTYTNQEVPEFHKKPPEQGQTPMP